MQIVWKFVGSLIVAAVCSAHAAAQEVGESFKDCDICPEMVVIPLGSFMMGSPEDELGRFRNEGPRHRVTISQAFAVGKYEVTFDEWAACALGGGCSSNRSPDDEGWGRKRRPAINVNWQDAKEFTSWLGRKTGKSYRLLSEAEWEYAARAGTTTAYSWGGSASHEWANYGSDDCCSGLASGRDAWVNTAPVGSFQPNAFGLYDVHGNVWEWAEDCWHDSYAGAPSDGRPWTSGGCEQRVLRGGSWQGWPLSLRSALRFKSIPASRDFSGGLRVARELE